MCCRVAREIERRIKNSQFIIKTSVVDPNTGEVLSDRKYVSWSGWKNDSYKYRNTAGIRLFDDMDWDLNGSDLRILLLLCKIMNDSNLLIKKADKWYENYFGKRYIALTKEEIYENLPGKNMSWSTFMRTWKKLTGKYVKKIKVQDYMVWAVNPAYAMKSSYLPLYLYVPFKEWIDPFLTEATKKKFESIYLESWNGD